MLPGSGDDDESLVARWASDMDGSAFGSLVVRHGGLMRRAAAVALGSAARRDPDLVDDAVQEACVRLVDALRSFRGDSSPATFMAAVARRAALDELRRGLRHRARGERAARLAEPPDPAGLDPAAAAERKSESDELLALLYRLPEPERSLVYLRDAEGIGVRELAGEFGLPEGTVKSKLARARARLKEGADRAWGTA